MLKTKREKNHRANQLFFLRGFVLVNKLVTQRRTTPTSAVSNKSNNNNNNKRTQAQIDREINELSRSTMSF